MSTTGHIFLAMSLDGYIARQDDGLDWLMKQPTEGEDHGFDAFMASVDCLIMGSNTFHTVLGFGEWPYTKPVIVLSRTMTEDNIPCHLKDKTALFSGTPKEAMDFAWSHGYRRAYVDGGKVVQAFLREDLIQDMVVTVVPILIGHGKSLFGAINSDKDLDLVECKPYPSGLVRLKYAVKEQGS